MAGDVCSMTQLLVFACGTMKEVEVDRKWQQWTTAGSDLFMEVHACSDRLEEREACQTFEVNARKGDCNYFIVHQEAKDITLCSQLLWEMLISQS